MKEDVISAGGLTDEQDALLELLLAQEGFDTVTTSVVTRWSGERESFPLSFAQQRLWFLDQLFPDSTLYTIPKAFKISGPLDRTLLERALNALVLRHETLRTNFVAVDGQPVQVIAPHKSLMIQVIELPQSSHTEQTTEIQRLLQEELRKPFNLAQDMLLRVTLFRLNATEHVLLMTMHHIISDSWSEAVLLQEISILYQAFAQGHPSPLAELPIQYADFTLWQREWLQGETRTKLVEYWQKQLHDLPVLHLPTDHSRPTYPTFNGAVLSWKLDGSLVSRLKALSNLEGVTLFMTLLAAFQVLLARYSGQDDIVIGSPIANRTQVAIENIIGFFANTLVLRTDLSGDPSFQTLLQRNRQILLDAYAHQDLPFEQLVEELGVPRDPSRNPLFQVMFNFENTPQTQLQLADATLQPLAINDKVARFDLIIFVREEDDELYLTTEYSTDLFDQPTIERLHGHYQTILQSVVSNPQQSLSAIPLLTPDEYELMIHRWDETATPHPFEQCIHHLIETQVERSPQAIAVQTAEDQLTYQHLNTRANHLAHHLISQGVLPGMRVGISLPRSLDAIVALLAILKAGAAYVPIDPAHPAERISYMLSNAQISILLTHATLLPNLPTQHLHTICLDRDQALFSQQPEHNPSTDVQPAHLFYTMYTSGSTGHPKGVAMSHRALCNLLFWQLETMVPPRAARLLQFASLSFDVSFQEIFPTLSAGGTIVLITEELRRDPLALLRFISQHRVEKLYLPVVALQQLADVSNALPGDALLHLREITAAGEQLQITPQVVRFFQLASNCTLHNFYGPTETHGVTIYTLEQHPEQWPRLVPIGRPIANTQTYILDPHGSPVPIGVVGELYLGGICVADGYLNRPDLTAERFVPDPFGPTAGARLYKTGDLARYRADGIIEFLGRIDHQVKIRGFRVELEEVEAVLNQHPAVRESVVVVREEVPGDKRLVAYVVTETQQDNTSHQLRHHMQAHLPEYMQPSQYVFLDALPLTLNRKVDHRRLPAPPTERPALQEHYTAARTPTEQQLVSIWQEILRLERIGIHDNFFELGGHSLLITQVVSRVRTRFGVEVAVKDLFAMPHIELLAKHIDELVLTHLNTSNIDDMLNLLDEMDDAEVEQMLKQS